MIRFLAVVLAVILALCAIASASQHDYSLAFWDVVVLGIVLLLIRRRRKPT